LDAESNPESNRRTEREDREVAAGSTLGAFMRCQSLDQIERVLLAYAVHSRGAGFERAHLLLHDPRSERLICRASHVRSADEPSLEVALEQARCASQLPSPPASLLAWIGRTLDATRLEGPAALAWRRLACASGDGSDAPSPWREAARIGAVPLDRNDRPWALMIGEWADPAVEESRASILETVRPLIETAIAVCDRAAESVRRARQAAALAEMARGCVSPANLAEVLHLAARLASSGVSASGGAVWLAADRTGSKPRASRAAPRLEVTYGAPRERERRAQMLMPLAASATETGRSRVCAAPTRELDLSPEAAAAFTAIAVVPLSAYDRVLGAIAVYDPCRVHPSESAEFDAQELEFVETIAHLVSLAVVEAGRRRDLDTEERRNRELTARLSRQERLCALGERAAGMARDARNPLASIRAFARRMERALENDPRQEFVQVILAESERLERLVSEPLEEEIVDHSAMKIESVNTIVQEALERAGSTLVRRRIRLMKKLSPEIPSLLLDGVRLRRALGNILDHALESVTVGGRIRVESRQVAHHVVLEIAHDAHHAPGDALEQMLVPFANGTHGGGAVGLGVASQIVREHGGEVRVRSEGEWGSVVALTFPVSGNQDRRRVPHDRRHARSDRRARSPQS
jgi:signal transduction histidine kinase